ncbi:MAG: ferredoxin family protein [Candidatus Aminicenantales bacterium]
MEKIEEKLAVNKFDVDKEVHIKVKEDKCLECEEQPCLYACPAGCFKYVEDHITFSYEGCLECGTCRIICSHDALEWTYPRPGFGICYEYG